MTRPGTEPGRNAAPVGFSLIEVLVALAVLGLALSALLPRTALGGLAAERAQRTEVAVLLAEDLLAQAGRTLTVVPGRTIEGRTEAGFSWRVTADGDSALIDLAVEVRWSSFRGPQQVALATRRVPAGAGR
jgi:general secretion pathway protein I